MGTAAEDDEAEDLVDKLRGGEFNDMIQAANQAQDAQLCLQADGGVKRADPYTHFAGTAPPVQAKDSSGDDELKRAREARMAQLKHEHTWRQQGHGSLRELADEREFIEVIGPHERAVVLLDDGRAGAAEDVKRALDRLAKSHLEAQFCRLPVDRARFLTHMVELQGLPTIFVLRDGQVTRQLPPHRLFEYASASSPLFGKHLAKLLHRVDALMDSEGVSSSEDERDDDEEKSRLGGWRRI